MAKIERPIVLGTGQLGMTIMDELAARGVPVRMVNRSGRVAETLPADVTVRAADLYDSKVVQAVCEDADVVFLCAQPDYTAWPEQFPPLIDAILSGLKDRHVSLVFGDNLYMYGPTGGQPLREDLPYAATGHKGKTRADVATRLLAAHNPGKLEVVLGRGSDFYGPRVTDSAVGETLFGAAIAGKTVNLVGDIDLPHTYTYIRDFAHALITLAEAKAAYGQAWHVPNAPTQSTRAFVEEIESQLGQPLKVRTAGRRMLALLGLFDPMLREMQEMYYEFGEPYIVDDSKYRAAFGDEVTPREEAIRATLDWYREHAKAR
jgi:nucleoside-diphosphate-sugar epimerase